MNLFDIEYYPTPEGVFDSMEVGCHGKIVLEPSAGVGHIVGYLKKHGAEAVLACEKDPDLRRMVSLKCDVIAGDFFTVKAIDVSHIDMIVMNPPFSNADRHILHAWEIAPEGCEIIALCNYQTISNTYNMYRGQVGKLIDNYGMASNLGDVFTRADRTTGIDIGLIKLYKPVVSESTDFEGFYLDADEEPQENGLMRYDEIRATVQRYVAAAKCFDRFETVRRELNELVGTSGGRVSASIRLNSEDGTDLSKELFLKRLQMQSWQHVFAKLEVGKYVTEGVLKDLNKFIDSQKKLPFTIKNIYRMFEIIIATRGQTMQKAIVEAVDNFTQHTHENRYGVEGWKTNEGHLLNKKFIINGLTSVNWISGKIEIETDRRNYKEITDLVKALCFITGTNFDDIPNIRRASLSAADLAKVTADDEKHLREWKEKGCPKHDKPWPVSFPYLKMTGKEVPSFNNFMTNHWYDWGFFEVKVFKRGTGHFRFKDDKVWELLNRTYAKIKGQVLPEGGSK
ncbi:hypothetical protein BWI93_01085 [Siphonobacter sp. BAB-5385]|uniref:class I SAM-dependent methyltransferase n=1 Tax=Siphonobacter sp. BAB-5385 TaxID=1864822 RepID=UPI000B9E3BBF|nr:DUF4942 domain-containing protein [Siphonobacter sp. BAB-5385]OZI09965.1 hypothetical protein BWI93_01085 [Siphonobacter sp. BAB-5385]